MPSPDSLTIRSGPLTARFNPAHGGRMTHLVHERFGDILIPTADAPFDPWNWPKAGAYPLFPFHNRLLGAAFDHEGSRYSVTPHPALQTDAQHGPAHRRPWSVTDMDEDRITLALDYEADGNWPFAFRAEQHFVLEQRDLATDLQITLSLTNRDRTSMPGGFGWHPYFSAKLQQEAVTDAGLLWPVDENGIPNGRPPTRRQPNVPLANIASTLFLSDWHHAGTETAGGAKVSITADRHLPHLVAHRTEDYLCLEPVSHLAGALGLAQEVRKGHGIFLLRPAESRMATIRITILA